VKLIPDGVTGFFLQKLFGVGPIGAGINLILLVVAIRVDRALGHPEMLRHRSLMEILGAFLICAGLVLLHFQDEYRRYAERTGRFVRGYGILGTCSSFN
jgi:hypothetical protein